MNAPATASHLLPQIHLREVPQALIDALQSRFGAQCSLAQAVREQHGRDEGSLQAPPPSAVVFAESTQDVADAVKLASQYDVPVIPYGAGSSLEGHLLAVQGGISIDVGRMNRVLSINADDLTVTVQPGITRKQLNEAIKDTGAQLAEGVNTTLGAIPSVVAPQSKAAGFFRDNADYWRDQQSDVLKGRIAPPDCPLFGKKCTPANPVGPCMVSTEGSCAAYFKYNVEA